MRVKGYGLTILEKDGKKDVISGYEIHLEYQSEKEAEKLLKSQNGFLWPKSLFETSSRKIEIYVSYDEQALEQKIAELSCLKAEQTPAENAKLEFDGQKYVIKPEVYGNAVNKERLTEQIKAYITRVEPSWICLETGCYANPKYVKDSKEVKAACDTMTNT